MCPSLNAILLLCDISLKMGIYSIISVAFPGLDLINIYTRFLHFLSPAWHCRHKCIM